MQREGNRKLYQLCRKRGNVIVRHIKLCKRNEILHILFSAKINQNSCIYSKIRLLDDII